MLQNSHQIPDLSVDFMSWLNAELRRHIAGGKPLRKRRGAKRNLVSRLRGLFSRQ